MESVARASAPASTSLVAFDLHWINEETRPEFQRGGLTFLFAVNPGSEPVLPSENDAGSKSLPLLPLGSPTCPGPRDVVAFRADRVVEDQGLMDGVGEEGRVLRREEGRDASEEKAGRKREDGGDELGLGGKEKTAMARVRWFDKSEEQHGRRR